MTKEDKDLLLRYMSMALPYNVKVIDLDGWQFIVKGINEDTLLVDEYSRYGNTYHTVGYGWKPFLRPLVSMTEEERTEINALIKQNRPSPYGKINLQGMDNLLYSVVVSSGFLMDWMLKKHFDIFDLIPKELAIAVTKENNPYDTRKE